MTNDIEVEPITPVGTPLPGGTEGEEEEEDSSADLDGNSSSEKSDDKNDNTKKKNNDDDEEEDEEDDEEKEEDDEEDTQYVITIVDADAQQQLLQQQQLQLFLEYQQQQQQQQYLGYQQYEQQQQQQLQQLQQQQQQPHQGQPDTMLQHQDVHSTGGSTLMMQDLLSSDLDTTGLDLFLEGSVPTAPSTSAFGTTESSDGDDMCLCCQVIALDCCDEKICKTCRLCIDKCTSCNTKLTLNEKDVVNHHKKVIQHHLTGRTYDWSRHAKEHGPKAEDRRCVFGQVRITQRWSKEFT